MGNTVARSHIRETDRGVAKATRANTRRNSAFTQQTINPPSPSDSTTMLVTYPSQLLPSNPCSSLDSPDSPSACQQPHVPSTFGNAKLALSRPDPPLDPPLPPRAIRQRPVEEAGERVSQTKRRQRHVSADIAFSRSMSVSSSLPRDARSSRSNSSSAVHPSSVDARVGRETPRFRDRDDPSALCRIPSHSPPPSTSFSSSSSSPQSVPNYASLLSANPSKSDAVVAAAAEARTSSILESVTYQSQFPHNRFHRPIGSHVPSPFRRSNIQIDPSLPGATVRDCQTARTQTPPRADKPPHARKVVSFNENVHIVTYPYESSDTYSSNSDVPSITRFSDLKQPRRRGRSMFRLLSRSTSNNSENDSLTSETLNFQYDLCGGLPPESDAQAVYHRLVPSHSASISSSESPDHELTSSAYDTTGQQPIIIAYENSETRSSVSKPSDAIEGAVTDDYDYTDRKELENADTLSLSDAHLSCDGIEEPEAIVDQLFSQSRENAMEPRASTSFDIAPLWQRLKRVDELDAVDLSRRSHGSVENSLSLGSNHNVGSSSEHGNYKAVSDCGQEDTLPLSRQSQNVPGTQPDVRGKALSGCGRSQSDVSDTQVSDLGRSSFPSPSMSSRNEKGLPTVSTRVPTPSPDFESPNSAEIGPKNVDPSDLIGCTLNMPHSSAPVTADLIHSKADQPDQVNSSQGGIDQDGQKRKQWHLQNTKTSSALAEVGPNFDSAITNPVFEHDLKQSPRFENENIDSRAVPESIGSISLKKGEDVEIEENGLERTKLLSKNPDSMPRQAPQPIQQSPKIPQKHSGYGKLCDDNLPQAENIQLTTEPNRNGAEPELKMEVYEQSICDRTQVHERTKQELSALDQLTCKYGHQLDDHEVRLAEVDERPCKRSEEPFILNAKTLGDCRKGFKSNWTVSDNQKNVTTEDNDLAEEVNVIERKDLETTRLPSFDPSRRVDMCSAQKRKTWDGDNLANESSGSFESSDIAEDMTGRISIGLKITVPVNSSTSTAALENDQIAEKADSQLPNACDKQTICQAIFRGQESSTVQDNNNNRKCNDEREGRPIHIVPDGPNDRKLPLLGSCSADVLSKKISSAVYMGEMKDKSMDCSARLERKPSSLSDTGQIVSVSSAVSKIEQSTARDATAVIGNLHSHVRRRKAVSNVQPLAHMLSSGHSSSSSVPSQDGGVSLTSQEEDGHTEYPGRDIASMESDDESLSDLDLNGIRLSSHDDYSVNTSGLNRSYSPMAGVYYGTSSPSLVDQLSHDTELGRNEGRASYPEYEILKGKEDSIFGSEPDTALGECGEWSAIDTKEACALEIVFNEERIQTKPESKRISSQENERGVPEVLLHEWSGSTPVEPNVEMEDSASNPSSSSSLQIFKDKIEKDREATRSVRLSSRRLGAGLSKLYGRNLDRLENGDRDGKLVTSDKKISVGESSCNHELNSDSRFIDAEIRQGSNMSQRRQNNGRGISDHGIPNQGNIGEAWIGDKSVSMDNQEESNDDKLFFATLPNGYAVDPKLQDFQMSVQRKSISEIGYRRSGRATGRGASFVEGEYRQIGNEGESASEVETRILPKEVRNEASLRRRTGGQRRRRLSNVETTDGLNRGHEGLAFRGMVGRLVSGMHMAKKLVIPN